MLVREGATDRARERRLKVRLLPRTVSRSSEEHELWPALPELSRDSVVARLYRRWGQLELECSNGQSRRLVETNTCPLTFMPLERRLWHHKRGGRDVGECMLTSSPRPSSDTYVPKTLTQMETLKSCIAHQLRTIQENEGRAMARVRDSRHVLRKGEGTKRIDSLKRARSSPEIERTQASNFPLFRKLSTITPLFIVALPFYQGL